MFIANYGIGEFVERNKAKIHIVLTSMEHISFAQFIPNCCSLKPIHFVSKQRRIA